MRSKDKMNDIIQKELTFIAVFPIFYFLYYGEPLSLCFMLSLLLFVIFGMDLFMLTDFIIKNGG